MQQIEYISIKINNSLLCIVINQIRVLGFLTLKSIKHYLLLLRRGLRLGIGDISFRLFIFSVLNFVQVFSFFLFEIFTPFKEDKSKHNLIKPYRSLVEQ
ncbi:hypothetical protein RclHR1_21670001 [Rhizophagus clarus]|uniref:Uncharacterized protein n=1 Tax=Rhizophagus clarus TaxID=94130 RepID=A0A2Z6R6L4_9GLOM|nr:hypothetical protein RclHR1_21670001 [Rhizophagus clarus]